MIYSICDIQYFLLLLENECVERFVYGVDATLRRQHEQEKLSSIVSRIESYDAIDCSNDEAEKVIPKYAIHFVTISTYIDFYLIKY